MIYPEDEFSWSNYQPKEKFMLTHNLKTFAGLALVFLIGGLSALKGVTLANGIETLLPILLAIEHIMNGNV